MQREKSGENRIMIKSFRRIEAENQMRELNNCKKKANNLKKKTELTNKSPEKPSTGSRQKKQGQLLKDRNCKVRKTTPESCDLLK